MMFDDKRVKEAIDFYIKKYPGDAYHMQSKLNCLRYEQQVKKCAKIIPKNAKVLDLGCGWGQVSVILSIIRPDLKIIGIDIEREPLWKKLNKFKCKFTVGDALNLKFKGKTFDSVVAFGLMEHVSDDKKLLQEIYRVSKPNAINFIFNLPNKYSLNEFGAKILKIGCHDRRYTKKQIKRLVEKAGKFKIIGIGREFLIPAQVNRISRSLNNFFNTHYLLINKLDKFLVRTPLNIFAESYFVVYKKSKK